MCFAWQTFHAGGKRDDAGCVPVVTHMKVEFTYNSLTHKRARIYTAALKNNNTCCVFVAIVHQREQPVVFLTIRIPLQV